MPDEIEPTVDAEAPAGGETQQVVPNAEQQAPTGGNPAFEPIRSELGDLAYSRIEKHLKDFDSNNNKRFEKQASETKWARDLMQTGVTPDRVQASLALAQQIDADPAAVYEQLGKFLQQNGRMPQTQQEMQQVQQAAEDEDGEQQPLDDPRLAQALQQNEQIINFLRAQAEAEQSREADLALDTELDALKQAHPEFAREDIAEVIQRAFTKAQMGKSSSLEEAAQEFLSVRDRILSTPRPGDSAPRLVPTSGGSSAQSGQRKFSDMSRNETQDLIASLIAQDNQRG